MKPKTISIIAVSVSLFGIFLTAIGSGMNDRPGLKGSGSIMSLVGLAVLALVPFLVLYAVNQTKK